jgi:hypothetical protein
MKWIKKFNEGQSLWAVNNSKKFIDEISDIFTIDIADPWDMRESDRNITGRNHYSGLTDLKRSDFDRNGFVEKKWDEGINFEMWFPFEKNDPSIIYNSYGNSNNQVVMEEYYPGLYDELYKFIKRVYSECDRRKMKLDWRYTSRNGPRITLMSVKNEELIQWISVDIYFKIDVDSRVNENKLFESEELYTRISTEEHLTSLKKEIVPIDKYIKQLDRLLSKYYSCKYEKRRDLSGPVLNYTCKESSMAPLIDIRLFDDDWFSIGLWYRDNGQFSAQYYKCDQLHGVEKLLKDKHII